MVGQVVGKGANRTGEHKQGFVKRVGSYSKGQVTQAQKPKQPCAKVWVFPVSNLCPYRGSQKAPDPGTTRSRKWHHLCLRHRNLLGAWGHFLKPPAERASWVAAGFLLFPGGPLCSCGVQQRREVSAAGTRCPGREDRGLSRALRPGGDCALGSRPTPAPPSGHLTATSVPPPSLPGGTGGPYGPWQAAGGRLFCTRRLPASRAFPATRPPAESVPAADPRRGARQCGQQPLSASSRGVSRGRGERGAARCPAWGSPGPSCQGRFREAGCVQQDTSC